MANKPKSGTELSTSSLFGATPQVATKVIATGSGGVKVSTPDLNATNFVRDNLGFQDEDYANLILDSINAREIISISTVDALVSQNPTYEPIQNLAQSNFDNSSERIMPNANTEVDFFRALPINLFSKTPTAVELIAEGEVDEIGNPRVTYIDQESLSLVINFKDIINEEAEVSFVSFSSLNDDTIY